MHPTPISGASAEILSIGTELLLGDVLDTNSQFFARELAALAINCFYRTTVGDNPERIKQCLRLSLDRCDLIITSGGLGPTPDDLTIQTLADFFGVNMVFDEAEYKRISNFFGSRGIAMPESNRKQAMRPEGSDILPNAVGTAPGIIWRLDEKLLSRAAISNPERPRYILTFPGVPSELKKMWRDTALSYLQKTLSSGVFFSCELKHFGIGESALAEKFSDLLNQENPTVAPYAGRGECRLRVTARGGNIEEAKTLAQGAIDEIRRRSGTLCYGRDDETLESIVGSLLINSGMTLSTAESCTGGLLSKRLTDISGSSRYTSLNLVTYANEAKQKMLGVPEDVLATQGAVSPECAQAMAQGVRRVAGSDLGVSITGIAGPEGGTPEKPVGLVYLGLSTPSHYFQRTLRLPESWGRQDIRFRTASEALNMVRLYLLDPALV